MKKILAVLVALALVLGVSCTALADEPVTIQFWSVFTGDDGAVLQALVDEFNTEYAGKINVVHSPLSDPYTNLYLAVQSSTDVPDVMIGHIEQIPKLAADGILTDVEYLTEGDVDLANYPEHVLERSNIDGTQYGIPWDFNAPVLYVNLDLIAKYGLESILEDRMVTFDELKQAGEAVKAAGDLETVKINNYYGNFNQYVARYEQMAQQELIQDGKLVIDTVQWGKVIDVFRELNDLGYAIGREDDANAMFLGGSLMFYEAGTWTNATLMQVEGLNYDCVPVTVYNPETALVRSGSHTWMQPENEDRTEETDMAVATFINWMGAHSLTWATKAGQVPLYKSVTEMDEFKACKQTFLAQAGLSDHIKIFQYYYWNTLTDVIGRTAKDVVYDETIDSATVGAGIQQEVEDAIAAGA